MEDLAGTVCIGLELQQHTHGRAAGDGANNKWHTREGEHTHSLTQAGRTGRTYALGLAAFSEPAVFFAAFFSFLAARLSDRNSS